MPRLRLASGSSACRLLATVIVLASAGAIHAVDNDPGPPQTLNCGDPNTRDVCIECDSGTGDAGKLICCDYDGQGNPTCPIVNEPPTTGLTGPDLAVKFATSGLKVTLQRKLTVKGGQAYLQIKLKETFVSSNVRKSIDFKGTLTGTDASIGSLAYVVAYLGLGDGALGALQGQGKSLSLSVVGAPRSCQASFSPAECTGLAIQLSKLIDGALPPGSAERAGFLQSVQPFGLQPCQIFC
jgi:hypothetical protein